MATYDADNSECFVLTFKEGMLSALAHDLKHRVTRFRIDVNDETKAIDARFDAGSLRVATVMKKGVEAPDELGPDHFEKIQANVVKDVLHPTKFPEIRFTSTSVDEQPDGFAIEGTLNLHGVEKPLSTKARKDGDGLVVDVEIHQPDFGIKPFSAMMGTLKVKPTVTLRLRIPAPG